MMRRTMPGGPGDPGTQVSKEQWLKSLTQEEMLHLLLLVVPEGQLARGLAVALAAQKAGGVHCWECESIACKKEKRE